MDSTTPEEVRRELKSWFLKKGIDKVLGKEFGLSPCPFTEDEIELTERRNEIVLCLPKGLSRKKLGELFGLENWSIEKEGIKENVEEEDRWFSTPKTLEPPYPGKSAVELMDMFMREGLEGLSLEMYLVFAAKMKDFGLVPDLKKSSWLLRTTYDLDELPLVLSAGFFSEDCMVADTRMPEDRIFNLGGRYARVARHKFIQVGKVEDFPEGVMKEIKVADRKLLISNVSGKIYAIENRCSHEGQPLTEGTLENYIVTCPAHGATFDIRTGEMKELPVGEPEFSGFQRKPVKVFDVIIAGDKVLIKV